MAPPTWPPASFWPALITPPACRATLQTLPTTPLTHPPSEHRVPPRSADAGEGAAQKHRVAGYREERRAPHFAVVPRCAKKLTSPGAAPTISADAPEISAAMRPRAA